MLIQIYTLSNFSEISLAGPMFSMILFVLIIILTLCNFGEIAVAAPYVLKDFIEFDANLNFRQF